MLFLKNTFLGLRAVLLASLAIFLMVADRHLSYFVSVRSVFISMAAPLQHLVNWPVAFLDLVLTDITTKKELLNENAKLRAERLLLQAKIQKLVALEQENAKLRGLITSVAPTHDKFLIAELLATNPSNFSQQLILDKGKQAGVYIGQPVLDAYGLVGQVILVGINTSVVLLITDPKSAIPVQVNRNGTRAIALGSGDGSTLELIQIAETEDVQKGDLLVTSDLGARFAPGYPVGQIMNVDRIPGERFLKIAIKPNAHISQNHQVLLIWPGKNKVRPEIDALHE